MTTQEIADQWANYCLVGNWDDAQKELYDNSCVSIEMPGAQGFPEKVKGIEAIKTKGEKWSEMIQEFHGVQIDGPIVAGDHFSATMKMDITPKDGPRRVDEEIGVFRVENGKIVSEQFFYATK